MGGEEPAEVRSAVVCSLCTAPGEAGWGEVSERVAETAAAAEPEAERARWSERFADSIRAQRFLPSLPILSNAGRSGQLAACFVLEPQDSLASIYETLACSALIQQGSGGAGIHFSRLRARGSPIRRSGGISPGPLAFIELFAHSAQVNRRAGRRPGAHLAILSVDHPDALDFIRAARERSANLSGMGLALGLTDAFLSAAGGESAPPQLLAEVGEAILETGGPSLLFLDAIEAANPTPHLGPLRATNPCGEQPLLPGESCVLGSLHLPAFADDSGELDEDAVRQAAREAVRFLDDVVSVARYPNEKIRRATLRTRKIGLGLMGLADLALMRDLEYESTACRELAAETIRLIAEAAQVESQALAKERGPYPAWNGDGTARRNATQLAVAPTGTLRLIAGCSGGIEPLLNPVRKLSFDGVELRWVDRWLEAWMRSRTSQPEALLRALESGETAATLPGLGAPESRLLQRGPEIDPSAQILLHAAVQRHVDGAVSKTVHLPPTTTAREVLDLVSLAHRVGCKGVSFFRAGGSQAPCVLRSADLRDEDT
jgi:ribonucleoside-diphosphate reductase alpha chain